MKKKLKIFKKKIYENKSNYKYLNNKLCIIKLSFFVNI